MTVSPGVQALFDDIAVADQLSQFDRLLLGGSACRALRHDKDKRLGSQTRHGGNGNQRLADLLPDHAGVQKLIVPEAMIGSSAPAL